MKFRIPNNLSHNLLVVTRKIGYFKIINHETNQESYVKRLTQNRYPRFHLYITESEKEVVFDLHLDQSSTVYKGQTAHNADYESDNVRFELARIFHIVNTFNRK